MLLAVRISSYGCTQEARVTLGYRLDQLLRFFRASITRYQHAEHEPILNLFTILITCTFLSVLKVLIYQNFRKKNRIQ